MLGISCICISCHVVVINEGHIHIQKHKQRPLQSHYKLVHSRKLLNYELHLKSSFIQKTLVVSQNQFTDSV